MTRESNERGVSEHLPSVGGEVGAVRIIEKMRDDYIREHCQTFNDGHWVGTNDQIEHVSTLDDIIEHLRRSLPPSGGWRNAVLEEAAELCHAESFKGPLSDHMWERGYRAGAAACEMKLRSLKQPLPEPPTPQGEGET